MRTFPCVYQITADQQHCRLLEVAKIDGLNRLAVGIQAAAVTCAIIRLATLNSPETVISNPRAFISDAKDEHNVTSKSRDMYGTCGFFRSKASYCNAMSCLGLDGS
jgi:hypothetical protein